MKKFLLTLILPLITCMLSSCSWMDERNSITAAANFYSEINGMVTKEFFTEATMPRSGEMIRVVKKPSITSDDIQNVELVEADFVDPNLSPELQAKTVIRKSFILIEMTAKGTRKLYNETVNLQGRRIVMSYNGTFMGYQFISQPITDGKLYITSDLPMPETTEIVLKLKENLPRIAAMRDRAW